jgi:hypothetical protein
LLLPVGRGNVHEGVLNIGVAWRARQRVWWVGLPWFPQKVDIELLIAGLPPCCFGDYRAWPNFRCLVGSHGTILGDPGDKRKGVHKESQSTFPPT